MIKNSKVLIGGHHTQAATHFRSLFARGVGCLFLLAYSQMALAGPADWSSWLRTEPRVRAAEASYQARLTEAEGAWSAYLPIVRGIGSAGSSKANDPLIRDGSKRTYGLEIEQPIPIFGRESARVELARAAVRVEAAELKRVEQTVLAELLESLAVVESAQATLALREQLATNLALQTGAAREAVAGGGMKLTEERQLLSRKSQVEALRTRAAADLSSARLRLQRLLPSGNSPIQQRPKQRDFWPHPLNEESFLSAALAGNPAFLKASAEAELAAAEHEVARADFWPKLSVTLQTVKGTFGAASADSQSAFIGVSVPFFEGGATVSRAESAAHKLAAAKEKRLFEEQMTRQRTADALARWQAAEAMVTAWAESERQEDESVALAEAQLADGGTTLFGVLRARQSRLEALLQGVDYRLERERAWITLMQEVGALARAVTAAPDRPGDQS